MFSKPKNNELRLSESFGKLPVVLDQTQTDCMHTETRKALISNLASAPGRDRGLRGEASGEIG
jgi:hypothetical protein